MDFEMKKVKDSNEDGQGELNAGSACVEGVAVTSILNEQDEDVPLVDAGSNSEKRRRQSALNSSPTLQRTLKNICLWCAVLMVFSGAVIFILLSHTDVFSELQNASSRTNNPSHQKPILSFQERQPGHKSFKIVQITDIHLGEAENLDWGPLQDVHTWHVLDSVLKAEAPIDLLVLGGDQLTANNCEKNATAYYQELGDFLSNFGVPWALIFGNHDDTAYEPPNHGERIPAKYSRRDLLEVDQAFPLSLTQSGPRTIDGTSNYVLDIYDGSPGEMVAAQVLLLDSGGGSIPSIISDSQISWVKEQISQSSVPAVAFQHIPTEAHRYANDGRCQGLHDDGFNPVDYDGGIVEALSETGRFFFLGVGHDHGMGYCCKYGGEGERDQDSGGMHVCFGRHSGYGGYGHWERGCRIYELSFDAENRMEDSQTSKTASMRWKSWVRLERGDIVDEFFVPPAERRKR